MSRYIMSGSVYQHREIAEKVLGRPLKTTEVVHHVDGDGKNNNNFNLIICPDQAYHALLHARQRIVDEGGHPDTHKWCDYHKELHTRDMFSTRPSSYDGLHNMCRAATNEYRQKNGLNTDKFDWKARLNQQYRRVFKQYTRRDICKL